MRFNPMLMLLMMLAGWINRQQQEAMEYPAMKLVDMYFWEIGSQVY